ncbi:MAG: hypothetical protein EOP04_13675 [Proteobacteria bacterium]|nr:MAG: hypothetical protein EOP04_13675 [Pseudomonadota bacterium]
MKEFVTLEQVNGNWAYKVRVGSAAPVAFLLVDSALANSFVFENKKHDFPQQIIYTKLSGEKLAAVISGPIEGKIVTEEFTLYRIKP